ncbi:hypothetical protein [Mesobacillus foraminis]|uniref:hypothetical protein n=1 Tax=Mesobacillus foraminis TaxID=279826 RepID=UPI000EF4C3F5|nr:hypothetical protein [Mesobacillus foraminis]
MDQHNHGTSHHHGIHHSGHMHMENEVNVAVDYKGNLLSIRLKDKQNNVPELAESHEKIMHLIMVSSDLNQFYHLHPVDKGNGIFQQEITLEDGSYKVFVDINPKNVGYQIMPIDLHVGHSHTQGSGDNHLKPDEILEKTINNKTVELKIDSLVTNKPTILTYLISGGDPDPYLGALGHVIIIDEGVTQLIHVHPVSDDKTVFETQFSNPGIYKVWSEFKFGEQVTAYPFVINVK